MKNLAMLFVLFCLPTAYAGTKTLSVTDPAVMGAYELVTGTGKDYSALEVRINNYTDLVIVADDDEFEIDKDNSVEIVNYYTDNYCEEDSCTYISNVTANLSQVVHGGKLLPQITLTVSSQSDAWNEDTQGTESEYYTDEYTFVWKNALEDAIPYFTYAKDPQAYLDLQKECKTALDTVPFYGVGKICPGIRFIEYRDDFDKAWDAITNVWGGKDKYQSVTLEEVQTLVFDSVAAKVDEYATAAKILDAPIHLALVKAEIYMTNNLDFEYYYRDYSGTPVLIAVDKTAKTVAIYTFQKIQIPEPKE